MAVMIDVSVVERDVMMRRGLASVLEEDPRIRVYTVGPDARTALADLFDFPSVVVIGPHRDGREEHRIQNVIGEVRAYVPKVPIVALCPRPFVFGTENGARPTSGHGNVTFLQADPHPGELIQTVIRVAVAVTPMEMERMRERFERWLDQQARMSMERLTARELDVVRLLGRRWGAKEIAETLGISHSTVRSHFRSIYAKLGVRNRHGAMARAARIADYLEGRTQPMLRRQDGMDGSVALAAEDAVGASVSPHAAEWTPHWPARRLRSRVREHTRRETSPRLEANSEEDGGEHPQERRRCP